MKHRHLTLLLLAAVCLCALPAAARTIDKHFHEEFPVDRGSSLFLHFDDGNVTFTAWDKSILDVEITYLCDYTKIGAGKTPDFDVEFKQRGKDFEVITKVNGGGGIGVFTRKTHRFEIEVKAPDWLILELTGDDGDVDIRHWRANIECAADDGDVELEDIECEQITIHLDDGDLDAYGLRADVDIEGDDGNFRLNDNHFGNCYVAVEDGDIRIKDSSGDFGLRADDGGIIMHGIEAGRIDVEVSDGDVNVSLVESKDLDIDIQSEDGDIDLHLGNDVSAEFEIETDDGDIDLDRSIEVKRDRDHRKSGVLGGGDGRIHLSSEDGDIRLEVGR